MPAAVFTAPFWLSLLLSVSDVAIDPLPLLRSLLATILAPLAVGKLARDALPPVRAPALPAVVRVARSPPSARWSHWPYVSHSSHSFDI